MKKTDWKEVLGWSEEQLEDIRNAGYAYIRQGKYETALSFFKALVVLNPGSSYDLQTLGALYLQTGDADQAVKYLDRALQLEANHSPTLLNLAKAKLMQGKSEEGLKLAKILSKDPDRSIARTAKALILAHS